MPTRGRGRDRLPLVSAKFLTHGHDIDRAAKLTDEPHPLERHPAGADRSPDVASAWLSVRAS